MGRLYTETLLGFGVSVLADLLEVKLTDRNLRYGCGGVTSL